MEILSVDRLMPHEETSKDLLTGLISAMGREAVQRDPIIVDRSTLAVLDGMHRLDALRQIGAARAACNLVDYMDEGLRLMRWMRCVRSPSHRLVSRLVSDLELNEHMAAPEALALINSGRHALGLLLNGSAFLGRDAGRDAAEMVRRFDRIAEAEGARTSFVDEPSLSASLRARDRALLVTPRLEKRDVTEAARNSRLFPYKTTMHLLRIRPVGLNVALSALGKGAKTPDLELMLRERPRRIVEPPAEYMGRTYGETLVVLS